MAVGRICQRDVDTATVDESVLTVAERMRQRSVECLVVVDKGQVPVGILTDRDLVTRVVAEDRNAGTTEVGQVMTRFPEMASEDMSIETALEQMRRRAFRRLPVIDNGGRLSGLITLDDILMSLAEELAQIGAMLGRETPRAAAAASG